LTRALADLYPGSTHVRDIGLATASDEEVWDYTVANGFTIVSKDADFHQRSFVLGHPPKVIWIRIGNCQTSEVIDLLRLRAPDVISFYDDPEASFLELS